MQNLYFLDVMICISFFFFFQAEDGIRDRNVTGVQTCALPILLGPLDTSHTTSNLQSEIIDDSATLYCYVSAQHFMPREGCRPGSENALLMNRYDGQLIRDGQKWRLRQIVIDNAWPQGNPEILNALAIQRVLTSKPKPPK